VFGDARRAGVHKVLDMEEKALALLCGPVIPFFLLQIFKKAHEPGRGFQKVSVRLNRLGENM
jgi:hypothetical protein